MEVEDTSKEKQRNFYGKLQQRKLKLRRLSEQNQRKKKIVSVEALVDELKTKRFINEELAITLKSIGVKPEHLIPKQVRNARTTYSKPKQEQREMFERMQQQNLKLKRLREQNRLKLKKIDTVDAVVDYLLTKRFIDLETANLLKSLDVTAEELFSKQDKNCRKIYSEELRSFALSLRFYSSKAYIHAKKMFNLNLPLPNVIQKWYTSLNGNPGFTSQSLETLKLIVRNEKDPLYCCLVLSEMQMTRGTFWDGETHYGYVDFGADLDTDEIAEASEALVFFITAVNANWKIPVGYFFVEDVNGEQRADLVLLCLRFLNDAKINIVGLSFNFSLSNLSMAKKLGCGLETEDVATVFPHPISKQPISIFVDVYRMIKCVVNCVQRCGSLINKDGKPIIWSQLERLIKLKNDLHTRNKHLHTDFDKCNSISKNNPKIYGQDLTASEFISVLNNLFDIFNSKHSKQLGYKKPLCLENKKEILSFLNDAEVYIAKLRDNKKEPFIPGAYQTGFLGLLICIKSTKELIKFLIDERKINSLSMYRFSPVHLNLFFSNIRAKVSRNNDPTCTQFKSFYKKLVNNIKIKKSANGDSMVELLKISILNLTSAVEIINETTDQITFGDSFEFPELELSINRIKRDYNKFCSAIPMKKFNENIVIYIAGYVVKNMNKTIKCLECNKALLDRELKPKSFELAMYEDNGLVYAAKDVVEVCKVAERNIKENMKVLCPPKIYRWFQLDTESSASKLKIRARTINKILDHFVDTDIFNGLTLHQFDQPPTENHLIHLIKAVADKYIDVRLHHLNNY